MRNALMAAVAAMTFLAGAPLQAQDETPVVKDGSTVSLEYTLKLDDGTTIQSNVGGEPLVYTQGQQQILPGLEEKLAGMKTDESRSVVLSPEEAFGPVLPHQIETVPLEMIPEDMRHEGAELVGRGEHGGPVMAMVKEVKEDSIVIEVDTNHPLAGQRLHFDIKVLRIE